MIIKFWGTRGSIPVPGKSTLRYGGNTPCIEVRTKNEIIILDAGSGIRKLGKELIKENFSGTINILLTHYHWDHIQGVPFFDPLYVKGNKINFYGSSSDGIDIEKLLNNQMSPSNFPVEMGKVNAEVTFRNIKAKDKFVIDGLEIETLQVNHSAPTLTYKIIDNDKKIVYMTDNELIVDETTFNKLDEFKENNKDLLDFCNGCDYLIHDAMYDIHIQKKRIGWGHSDNISIAYFSILAGVKNLLLFHYNPDYSDEKIDLLLTETQAIIDKEKSSIKCVAANEGLEITV